jgi:hypothetical protein
MHHVYWVIESQLAGRPGPTRHPWDPRELYAGGLRAVVSLAQEEPVTDLASYGLIHYQAQFPPVLLFSTGMRKAFIYQALPVWAFIHKQITAGIPTVVHCHAGKDRTGSILAGYLVIYQNVSPEDALRTLRTACPTAMSADGYSDVLALLTPGELPDPRTLL